jgi:MFS family permease
MQGVDNTILNVALPHVQGSLSASQNQIAWALTSYIVCAAIMMPSGWLAVPVSQRWVVERTFAWVYDYRRLTIDYERWWPAAGL